MVSTIRTERLRHRAKPALGDRTRTRSSRSQAHPLADDDDFVDAGFARPDDHRGRQELSRHPPRQAIQHTALVTFPDWREPTRHLEEVTGPPTAEQLKLAAKIGLRHVDEPRAVFAAAIEAWLRPTIWQKAPDPATERQLAFLDKLGHTQVMAGLSRSVASAWIEHYLAIRTTRALKDLHLKAGDVVDHEHTHVDPTSGATHAWMQRQTVSSIGQNGLVYFRGGNGQCGWPSQLFRNAISRQDCHPPP